MKLFPNRPKRFYQKWTPKQKILIDMLSTGAIGLFFLFLGYKIGFEHGLAIGHWLRI